MRNLLILLGVMLAAVALYAGEPVYPESSPNSLYGNTNDTISISSSSATSIAAISHRYRSIELLGDPDSDEDIYYRIDGTSTTITTNGLWFNSSTGVTLEYSGIIYLQLGAGRSAVTIRRCTSIK